MKSTNSGPFVKVDSSFVPDESIFRIEVVKVGKSNHTRFFAIHEKYILLYKVLPTLKNLRIPASPRHTNNTS